MLFMQALHGLAAHEKPIYSLLGASVKDAFDLLQLRRRNVLLQAVLQAFEIDATHVGKSGP